MGRGACELLHPSPTISSASRLERFGQQRGAFVRQGVVTQTEAVQGRGRSFQQRFEPGAAKVIVACFQDPQAFEKRCCLRKIYRVVFGDLTTVETKVLEFAQALRRREVFSA